MPASIAFDSSSGGPTTINYSVPLPGSNTGRRIISLDLDLDAEIDFLDNAKKSGESFAKRAGIERTSTGTRIDENAAAIFLRETMKGLNFDSNQLEKALAKIPQLIQARRLPNVATLTLGATLLADDPTDGVTPLPGEEEPDDPDPFVREFIDNAHLGFVIVPTPNGAGGSTTTTVPVDETPEPQLFLIEVYGVSSILGDYGMGRTVRTFTLLPGETTTIRIKTWRSTKQSIKTASSIIDSHNQSARDRFQDQIQKETTDKATSSKTEKWHVEAQAKASWGFGSAKVTAGASGEYQSGREQFSRQAADSVREHAAESSSRRELSVTSSTEVTEETGAESNIERTITNVNMRRVLNFVFRELNQTYTTKLHLKDIRVGFTNGLSGTWREESISGLRGLLEEVIVPTKIDETAKKILKIASVVFDASDTPVRLLESITYDDINDTYSVAEFERDANGDLAAPTPSKYYRFKRGPLTQRNAKNPVPGALLSENTTVMRTDSVFVEALLGEADALDEYAMEIQQAAATEKTLQNNRETLLQQIVADIGDQQKKAEAASLLFNPPRDAE